MRDRGGIRDVGKDSVALVIEAIPDHPAERSRGGGTFRQTYGGDFVGAVRFSPGQKVTARIIRVSGDRIVLDLGENGEGSIGRQQLEDGENKLSEFVRGFLAKS